MRGGVRGERPEEVYGALIGWRFEIPNGCQLAEGATSADTVVWS